jgi:hypothetical protein
MENNKNQNQTTEFENPVNAAEQQPKKKGMSKGMKVGLYALGAAVLTAAGYKVGHKRGHTKGFCLGAWAQAIADRTPEQHKEAVSKETGIPVGTMTDLGNQSWNRFNERQGGRFSK